MMVSKCKRLVSVVCCLVCGAWWVVLGMVGWLVVAAPLAGWLGWAGVVLVLVLDKEFDSAPPHHS